MLIILFFFIIKLNVGLVLVSLDCMIFLVFWLVVDMKFFGFFCDIWRFLILLKFWIRLWLVLVVVCIMILRRVVWVMWYYFFLGFGVCLYYVRGVLSGLLLICVVDIF